MYNDMTTVIKKLSLPIFYMAFIFTTTSSFTSLNLSAQQPEKGQTIKRDKIPCQEGKSVEEYWTPERMRSAKPAPMPNPNAPRTSDSDQVDADNNNGPVYSESHKDCQDHDDYDDSRD